MSDQTLIPVWDSISGAWQKVSGTKASIWAAVLIIILIALVLGLFQHISNNISNAAGGVVTFIAQVIVFLLEMGLIYIGMQRALDRPIEYRQVFRAFDGNIAIKTIAAYILQTLILLVPAILIFIGVAIYLSITPDTVNINAMRALAGLFLLGGIIVTIFIYTRMLLTFAFILDQELGPWNAIKKSFCATKSNVWRLIGIYLIVTISMLVSLIPLGIGLIWTIPLALIVYGQVYRQLLVNVKG